MTILVVGSSPARLHSAVFDRISMMILIGRWEADALRPVRNTTETSTMPCIQWPDQREPRRDSTICTLRLPAGHQGNGQGNGPGDGGGLVSAEHSTISCALLYCNELCNILKEVIGLRNYFLIIVYFRWPQITVNKDRARNGALTMFYNRQFTNFVPNNYIVPQKIFVWVYLRKKKKFVSEFWYSYMYKVVQRSKMNFMDRVNL